MCNGTKVPGGMIRAVHFAAFAREIPCDTYRACRNLSDDGRPYLPFFGYVHVTRKPALSSNLTHDREELLEVFVSGVALDLAQRCVPRFTSFLSPFSNFGHIWRSVLTSKDPQATLHKDPFVVTARNKQAGAREASNCELGIGYRPGHDGRVGEEEATSVRVPARGQVSAPRQESRSFAALRMTKVRM